MNIEDNRTKTIFRNENNGKVNYRIALNKREWLSYCTCMYKCRN